MSIKKNNGHEFKQIRDGLCRVVVYFWKKKNGGLSLERDKRVDITKPVVGLIGILLR